jgi:hypothetical protein
VVDASTLPDIYSGISQDVVNICANFSGHKYDDLACDGTAGSNPPLSGVGVKLLNAQGTPVAETTTDADGVYSFDNVPSGSYSICEDLSALPGGTQQSYPISGTGQTGTHPPYGVCYERTLVGGHSESDLDFYNCSPATATPTPINTSTPVPPTATDTSTPVPPTATDTNTPVAPTATDTSTPVPSTPANTSTPVSPTATNTSTPKATATEEHHNATHTPTEAASTSTATAVPSTPTPRGQVAAAVETRQPPSSAAALPASGVGPGEGRSSPWMAIAVALSTLAGTVLLLGGVRLAQQDRKRSN